MTPTETTTILRQFNNWCRDPSDFPPSPMQIEKAIDAAIEMIERLEAAEKSDAESLAMYRKARDERDALRAALRHEADCVEAAKAEIEALRAKIEAMERQEPVGKFTQHPSNGLWEQDGYGDNPDANPLYALPGAKGE
jgi:hypothetical protein